MYVRVIYSWATKTSLTYIKTFNNLHPATRSKSMHLSKLLSVLLSKSSVSNSSCSISKTWNTLHFISQSSNSYDRKIFILRNHGRLLGNTLTKNWKDASCKLKSMELKNIDRKWMSMAKYWKWTMETILRKKSLQMDTSYCLTMHPNTCLNRLFKSSMLWLNRRNPIIPVSGDLNRTNIRRNHQTKLSKSSIKNGKCGLMKSHSPNSKIYKTNRNKYWQKWKKF